MALSSNELYAEATRDEGPQMRPYDGGQARVTFADPGADVTYLKGTPVARNSTTGHWVVWSQAGTNEENLIRGFVYDREVNAEAGFEVIGNIMVAGEVHAPDVLLPSGESQANLDAALRVAGRTVQRLDIRGIADAA